MFLSRKELKKIISQERENGKSDLEIYNNLISKHKDKDEIVILLQESLKKEDRKKIRFWNLILLILIGLSIVLKIIFVLGLSINSGNYWTLLLVMIVPIFNVAFFFIVLNYKIQLYKFIGIFTMLGFVNSIGKMDNGLDLSLNIFFSVSIIAISTVLYVNYKPNKLKKDKNGNYIFN